MPAIDTKARQALLFPVKQVVREISLRLDAEREWTDAGGDEKAKERFDGLVEGLRMAIARHDPALVKLNAFDFYDFMDAAVQVLRAHQNEGEPARAELFLKALLAPLVGAVRRWVCVVPVPNLRLVRADSRSSPQRLGGFVLYPEMGSGPSERSARWFRSMLERHGVVAKDDSYRFDTRLFEHIDRKWRRGLTAQPLLVFAVEGSDSAWLGHRNALSAVKGAISAQLPAYDGRPVADFKKPISYLAARNPEPTPRSDSFLYIDARTGWFSEKPLSEGAELPGCGLALPGKMRRDAERVVSLLVLDDDQADELRARVARMTTMLLSADSARESFLQLLLLVVGLECLVSDKQAGEIQTRLADAVGLLLARDAEDYVKLRKIVRVLYQKRCDIVHRGDTSFVGESDGLTAKPASVFDDEAPVRQARWLLRGCIRRLAAAHEEIGKNTPPTGRDQAFRTALDRARFGGLKSSPWRRALL